MISDQDKYSRVRTSYKNARLDDIFIAGYLNKRLLLSYTCGPQAVG